MTVRRKKTLIRAAAAVAIAYLLVAIVTDVYARFALLARIDSSQDSIDHFETRIRADLKLLAEKPVYPAVTREKNAERLISGFVSWEGTEPLQSIEHDRLVDLMNQHLNATKSEEDWSALLDDLALEDLDLEWVDQLAAYDYIDFKTHPSFADQLARAKDAHGVARMQILATLPMPSFSELRFAALARAAQLTLENREDEAYSIYHHVSYLMSTTDTLIGSLSAASMLTNEKTLAGFLEAPWPLVDEGRILAMRRTAWAWGGLKAKLSKRGSLEGYEPYFKRTTNACATTFEMLGGETLLDDYLRPTVPMEIDLVDRLETQRAMNKKLLAVCDHPEFNVFLEPVNSPLLLGRWTPNPARIPFVRRVVGLNLIATAIPNYTRLYEDNPRQPASK